MNSSYSSPSLFVSHHVDVALLVVVLLLVIFGIFLIYSSNFSNEEGVTSNEHIRQIIWGVSGMFLLVLFSFIDYRTYKHMSTLLYVIAIAILLVTLAVGTRVNGAKSWIRIGSLGIQPAEFVKIMYVIFISNRLANIKQHADYTDTLKVIACLVPILALILLQPDFGTASVFIPVTLSIMFIAKIPKKHIVYLLLCTIFIACFIVVPEWIALTHHVEDESTLYNITTSSTSIILICSAVLTITILAYFGLRKFGKPYFYWIVFVFSALSIALALSLVARSALKEYQLLRLAIFINPYLDPQNAGWNVIQSLNAIGSGGISGRGFLSGLHSKYNFLPQQSTDFIFSILGEEFGFIGGLVVFALYFTVIFRGIRIVSKCRDDFGTYLGIGLIAMILFHFTINVGMAMGMMPVTGIPLLFLSHGGSSLWTSMIAIGIIMNIKYNQA